MKKTIDYQKGERFKNTTAKASILNHTDVKEGEDITFNKHSHDFEILRGFTVTITRKLDKE